MESMTEIWKPIRGYEGFYEASSEGRIRSLDREVKVLNQVRHHKGKILAQQIGSSGYRMVAICPEGEKQRMCLVHRLVALAFIGVPTRHRKEVNHKDHDKSNNRPDNLEWVTRKQNVRHEKGLHPMTEEKRANLVKGQINHRRAVIGTNLKTGEERFYESIKETKKDGFDPSLVCNICKSYRSATKGYTFRYAEHNN